MKVFEAVIKRLEQIRAHSDDLARSVFEQDEYIQAFILDANRSQLTELGTRSDDVAIETFAPYAPLTIMIKQSKGQPTDHVTLYDEGDFQGAFFLTFSTEGISVWSADKKTEELAYKYGKEIFGLTPKNIEELRDFSLQAIRDKFRNEFNLV